MALSHDAINNGAIDIERLRASQYMSAAGLVILLWDHVLTFPDEVRLIWSARLSVPKVLFLFNRYVVPCTLIVQSYEFSGVANYLDVTSDHDAISRMSSSTASCKVWYAVAVAVGMLSIATSNFLVLLRLWVLWNRSPRLMLGTLAFFVATQIAALSSAGYVIYCMLPTLIFDPFVRICVPQVKPNFVMLWSPGMAFELMVFLTTVWNALDRPRSRNEEMAKVMYRDGSLYFFGLFALRLVNMIVSAVAPPSLTFLCVFFVWSVCNITLARLVLNLRRLSVEGGEVEEEERTELPVLRRDGSMRSDPESQHKGIL